MRPPLPKEHGAWAQLAIASGAVILVARAHPPGFWAWLAALWAAFIAHEPLLLLLGQRGAKARKEHRIRAWTWMLTLAGLALFLGWFGMKDAAHAARWTLLVPL
ncbi:MAG TPA: YwiC-like family protein, partial [Holophagaceae bacterium]|nr:YwiC-like family protein [Holophagaceae bacterium]